MPARTVDCPFIVNLSVVIIIGGESPNFIITVMYLLGSNLLPFNEVLPWSMVVVLAGKELNTNSFTESPTQFPFLIIRKDNAIIIISDNDFVLIANARVMDMDREKRVNYDMRM